MSKTLPLPPLPPHVGEENHGPSQQPVKLYDADQMQAYALAAVEAQVVPGGWRDLMEEAINNALASTVEGNISYERRMYRHDLANRLIAMLAAAPPAPQAAACAERDARIAELEHQLAEARNRVAEECEKVCDGVYYQHIGPDHGEVRFGIAKCAAAIRERFKAQP